MLLSTEEEGNKSFITVTPAGQILWCRNCSEAEHVVHTHSSNIWRAEANDQTFKAILSYVTSSRPVWDTLDFAPNKTKHTRKYHQ